MESYLVYFLARFAMSSCRVFSRSTVIRMLDRLADLTYRLDGAHRRIARVNLKIAFPELSVEEHDRIAAKSFRNVARNLLEVSRIPMLSSDNIERLVGYDSRCGLDNFERARDGRKGILYMTGHFSAWELLPAAHALYGHPLSFVTRPLDNAPLERYLIGIRESSGNRVIHKKNSARRILQALKSAEDVGILMDQNTSPSEGVFADLFGVPAATTSSVALLALRTEVPVLPGYLTPQRDGLYTIKFLPPVELVRTGDMNRDLEINTGIFNAILERIIREQPESWLWGHKRWKNQPEGNPQDLYSLPPGELERFLDGVRSRKEAGT